MVRIGIVGLGFMGSMHAACYEQLQKKHNVKVIAVADLNTDKAKEIAKKFGAMVYGSAEDLIENANVTVVDICLPTFLHSEYSIKAMEKGYNVFVEKPVCRTLIQAEELLEAQRKTGSKVMVGHCIRLWPEYIILKRIVDSNKYGRIKNAVFSRISPKPEYSWENWLLDAQRSGSAALDLHIHDIDYIRYLLGEPDIIKAAASSYENPDHIFSILKYGDTIVSIEGGWDFPANMPFEMRFRVRFDNAVVSLCSNDAEPLKIYTQSGEIIMPKVDTEFHSKDSSLGGNISSLAGYYNELKYFIECLNENKEIEIAPLTEGIKSLKLVMSELAK